MNIHRLPLLSALLVLALALFCASAPASAAQPRAAATAARWSSPSTWPDRKLPRAGDAVTIPAGREVILDVSPPALAGLTVMGTLRFADNVDLELTTEWIMLHGTLEVGTEASPHTRRATITLTDKARGEVMTGMGDRGIMISGGTLSLHGDRQNTWTKLARTASAGSNAIEVLDASGWRVGDEIVLASTDYDPRQAERRTVAAIRGNTIRLDRNLEFMHFGEVTYGVDERGEVGLLTRNILIQASEDAAQSYFGGHVMAMPTSRVYVSGVEFNRMGQHLTLARYPIHWHLVGDATGQYIRNSAIHDTFNRCVTVHGTHNLRVENNVTYNIVGHCFFLEDGIETGNQFVKNLAIQVKCHPTRPCEPTNLAANGEIDYTYENRMAYRQASWSGKHTLLPSDNTVAAYWITNPDNSFVDNVAAGSDENGFWLSLPEHPNGAFLGTEASKNTWPRRTRIREFRNNTAHSNFDGFMFDRNINVDNTFGLAGNSYLPKENPADPESRSLETHFDNLTTYKNRNGGFWGRGELFLVRNLKTADNAIGFTMSSGAFGREAYTSLVVDSVFVAETDNVGNPVTAAEKAYGRSLPKRRIPDFPIRGYEYYDYRVDVANTTFVNYQDNAQRKAGALSWLLFTSSGVTTENTIKGAKYVNSKPVYFPNYDARFDNDNRGGSAYRTLAIHDLDGTTTGVPDSYILLHDGEFDSPATDDSCRIQPTWNASVCAGDVGRMSVGAPRPAGTGPGRPGNIGATLRLAAAGPAPAPQPPVIVSRNGRDHRLTGTQATVRAGSEMRVTTERPQVAVSLSEMDKGSWVLVELPGFAKAESGIRQESLGALHKASETSYFIDKDSLWVKLVAAIEPNGPLLTQTSVTANR